MAICIAFCIVFIPIDKLLVRDNKLMTAINNVGTQIFIKIV